MLNTFAKFECYLNKLCNNMFDQCLLVTNAVSVQKRMADHVWMLSHVQSLNISVHDVDLLVLLKN